MQGSAPSTWERRLAYGAAAWAAVALVVGATVLVRGDSPPYDRWRYVLLAFLAVPFALVALTESRVASAAMRSVALAAWLPAAAFASILSYLVALPAFAMLVGATGLATLQASRSDELTLGHVAGALALTAAVSALWVGALSATLTRADRRCADIDGGIACTSDVVTASEAALGLGLLGAAAVLVLAVVPLGRRPALIGWPR